MRSFTPLSLAHIFNGEFKVNGFTQNNGVLTCKTSGIYEINMSGNSYSETNFQLSLLVNDVLQEQVTLDISSGDGSVSSRFLKINKFICLNKGDKISFSAGTYSKNIIKNLIISVKYISE